MHRFIFIATFLPAVFLMDLLASSASVPEGEPLSINVRIAAGSTLDKGVSAAKAAGSISRVAPGPVKKEKLEFQCSDELYLFILDYIRGLEGSEKAGDLEGADQIIREAGIGNCDELFRVGETFDLNADGKPEIVVQTGANLWATARSDARTWVVQKTKAGYRVILDAGFVAWIKPGKKRVGGYFVLSSDVHNGGDGFRSGTYTYRDGEYRLTGCSLSRFNADPVRKKPDFCKPVF